MINEDIVTARIVNTQTMEFNEWCEHLADGSTVTPADVSAVMKQVEKRLPTILGLNTKVLCSAEGLTFRPKVSGSLTQSELKKKLEARKAAETDPEKAADIDVNRDITTSDLTVNDCTVSIVVDLPKEWSAAFMQKAKLKRVNKATTETAEDNEQQSGDEDENANVNPNANQNGGGTGTNGNDDANQNGGGSNTGDNTGGSDGDDPDSGME